MIPTENMNLNDEDFDYTQETPHQLASATQEESINNPNWSQIVKGTVNPIVKKQKAEKKDFNNLLNLIDHSKLINNSNINNPNISQSLALTSFDAEHL